MLTVGRSALLVLGVLVLAWGCNAESGADAACVPGSSQSCAGPGDCSGYQVCNEEGTGFEPCMCDSGSGGSGSGSGGEGGASASSSGGSESSAGGESSAASGSGGSSAGGASAGGSSSGATGAGGSEATSSGGATNAGGAASNGGTTGGSGGASSTGGSAGNGGTGGNPIDCNEPPTLMIVVDASSSMWENMFWEPLRDAVLGAVAELEDEVRFGLATFTGWQGYTCPLDLQSVGTVQTGNSQAIAEFYTAIEAPVTMTETPTPAALHQIAATLVADPGAGRKGMLLVTDGNPDYCDNGQNYCRADTTVRVIQDAHAAGVDTLVAALPDISINQDWLVAFANAGLGEPVSAPEDTRYCPIVPAATAALLGDIPGDVWPMGTYSGSMGPVAPANFDGQDVEGMTAAIVDLINAWADCE